MIILLDGQETYVDHLDPVNAHDLEGLNIPLKLEITIPWRAIDKTHRILVLDDTATWQEYIITSLEEYRDNTGKAVIDIKGDNSILELMGDHIDDKRPQGVDARTALNTALEGTRWSSGTVDALGLNSANFYRISCYEAVSSVVNTWGAEIRTRVVVSGTQITARYIDLLLARGSDSGRVITYDRDLLTIRKKTSPSRIYTALYGYGKGEAIDDGFGRRITFADINGGKAYVENNTAKALWGRNSSTGKVHVFGTVTFDDVDDKAVLLTKTTAKLAEVSVPAVSYDTSLANLETPEDGVLLGDVIGVRDKELGVELKTRVIFRDRNLLDPKDIELTTGAATSTFLDKTKSLMSSMEKLQASSSVWDRASVINADGTIPTSALDNLLAAVNAQLNATGGYVYLSETGEGLITYDNPVNPTKAIQLLGGAWRIANSKLGDGSWDWTTVGTGDGILAEAIVAGILKSADESVWIDLTNNTFNFGDKIIWNGSTFTINLAGGQTVEQFVGNPVMNTEAEFYLSTSSTALAGGSWLTTAPVWVNGKFMWTRTKVTYKDTTTAYRPSATGTCIAGATGATGKGISSAAVTYQSSTSGTVTPTGTWVGTIPAVADGSYLWTRTILTYSDTTTTTTYSVAKMGTQGPQGLQGLQGPNGTQGIQGPAGTSSYTHIAYSTSPTGATGFSTSVSAGATYIGMYVDSNPTDSETPTAYNWTLIKGADGTQGIQGLPGANGQTSYLHIAYATNATGTTGFSTTDSVAKTYIGQYTDFTSADSTNPALYSWSLIKGTDGTNGISVTSVNVWYYLSTSATALSGGTWSTTAPAWVNGKYMWSKVITIYSSGPNTESTPACITGAAGGKGSTGTGITSITEEYYLSTSKTAQSGGSWVTTPPTWSTGLYMWTRSKIVYNNPTSTVYTTALVDNAWEAVNGIEVGGRNFLTGDNSTGFTLSGGTVIFTELEADQFYTLSLEYNITVGTAPANFLLTAVGTTTLNSPLPVTGLTGKTQVTFKPNSTQIPTLTLYSGISSADAVTRSVDFTKLKLEKGTVKSDWSLSQEDIDALIGSKADNGTVNTVAGALDALTGIVSGKAEAGVLETLKSDYNAKVLADAALKLATETALSTMDGRVTGINTILGQKTAKWSFIETSITESEEGIFIGNEVTKMGVLIGTDRISFMDNNTEVAYIAGQTMQIENGIFVKSAVIGKHKIETIPGTDITQFTYVG